MLAASRYPYIARASYSIWKIIYVLTVNYIFFSLLNLPNFQDGISGWLCEEMTRDGLDIDQVTCDWLLVI